MPSDLGSGESIHKVVDQVFHDPRTNCQRWILIKADRSRLLGSERRLREISRDDQGYICLLLINGGSGAGLIARQLDFQDVC